MPKLSQDIEAALAGLPAEVQTALRAIMDAAAPPTAPAGPTWFSRVAGYLRMSGWGALAAAGVVATAMTHPAEVPVFLLKATEVCAGGFLGYWLDRHLFPYARPDALLTDPLTQYLASGAMLRRAAVVVGAMLALGLAL